MNRYVGFPDTWVRLLSGSKPFFYEIQRGKLKHGNLAEALASRKLSLTLFSFEAGKEDEGKARAQGQKDSISTNLNNIS